MLSKGTYYLSPTLHFKWGPLDFNVVRKNPWRSFTPWAPHQVDRKGIKRSKNPPRFCSSLSSTSSTSQLSLTVQLSFTQLNFPINIHYQPSSSSDISSKCIVHSLPPFWRLSASCQSPPQAPLHHAKSVVQPLLGLSLKPLSRSPAESVSFSFPFLSFLRITF